MSFPTGVLYCIVSRHILKVLLISVGIAHWRIDGVLEIKQSIKKTMLNTPGVENVAVAIRLPPPHLRFKFFDFKVSILNVTCEVAVDYCVEHSTMVQVKSWP